MRRGSSGAEVTPFHDEVIKRRFGDDGRLADQGRWIQRNSSPILPTVHRVYAESYVMERLSVPPIRLLNHHAVLLSMVVGLERHIWSRPAVVPINHEMLRAKIESLLRTYNMDSLWPWIVRRYSSVAWGSVRRCLTHGDPTFDNVMLRDSTGELVLVDPMPASLVNPDLWCVDIGKILQSALGWEKIRYPGADFTFRVSPADVRAILNRSDQLTINDWNASVLWCVIHLLRVLPYVDDSVRREVRRLIDHATVL